MVNYHETYMYFNNSYQSCTAVHTTARYLHVTARYLHANARHSTLMHATAAVDPVTVAVTTLY